jgi:hypothetical protein
MTYEIEIIEPRAQKLLEELANLNLIKFIWRKNSDTITREEHLAGLAESVKDVNAAIRGDIKLRNAYDLLAELEAEENA